MSKQKIWNAWKTKNNGSPPLTLVGLGGRLPVVRQNDRQTDATLLVNVRMVDLGFEVYLWRLERVLGREIDFNSERSLVVGRIILGGRAADGTGAGERGEERTQSRLVRGAPDSQSSSPSMNNKSAER